MKVIRWGIIGCGSCPGTDRTAALTNRMTGR
jgi:hypothetical protein